MIELELTESEAYDVRETIVDCPDGGTQATASFLAKLDEAEQLHRERWSEEKAAHVYTLIVGHAEAIGGLEEAKKIGMYLNPPFHLAYRLLRTLWPLCEEIVLLLRLSFLASEKRQAFLKAHPPSIYVLPNRPIFVHGQSDNCDYAWMRWSVPQYENERKGLVSVSTVRILDLTPDSERSS